MFLFGVYWSKKKTGICVIFINLWAPLSRNPFHKVPFTSSSTGDFNEQQPFYLTGYLQDIKRSSKHQSTYDIETYTRLHGKGHNAGLTPLHSAGLLLPSGVLSLVPPLGVPLGAPLGTRIRIVEWHVVHVDGGSQAIVHQHRGRIGGDGPGRVAQAVLGVRIQNSHHHLQQESQEEVQEVGYIPPAGLHLEALAQHCHLLYKSGHIVDARIIGNENWKAINRLIGYF